MSHTRSKAPCPWKMVSENVDCHHARPVRFVSNIADTRPDTVAYTRGSAIDMDGRDTKVRTLRVGTTRSLAAQAGLVLAGAGSPKRATKAAWPPPLYFDFEKIKSTRIASRETRWTDKSSTISDAMHGCRESSYEFVQGRRRRLQFCPDTRPAVHSPLYTTWTFNHD